MGTMKRWAEMDALQVGMAILTALGSLEHGEASEADLELQPTASIMQHRPTASTETVGFDCSCGATVPGAVAYRDHLDSVMHGASRWIRVANDTVNKRVVIFEIEAEPGKHNG